MKYKIIFQEFYETDLGELLPEEWRKQVMAAVGENGKTDLLEQIKDHCRKHCAWLHKEEEIEEYALECLVDEAYLYWKDFGGKVDEQRLLHYVSTE